MRDEDRISSYNDAIRRLTHQQFLDISEEVRQRVFTYEAWKGQRDQDKEFTTMCRYLQQAEAFLTLHHAIKYGDIGLLHRMVDQLVVWFYGAGQMNYGFELLHLRWLLSDGVSSAELQRAVLGSSLVNLSGTVGGFKPIDLALEHVNCCYSIDMKMFKNSTHDVDKVFGQVALTSSYISHLRVVIESSYGERTIGKHTEKSVLRDIFSLAYFLYHEGHTRPKASEQAGQFESLDVLRVGMELLERKVESFNATVPANKMAIRDAILEAEGEAEGDMASRYAPNVSNYVEAIDDVFHLDFDPTIETI